MTARSAISSLLSKSTVQAFIAIVFTLVASYLAIVGRIDSSEFMLQLATIVAFYFGLKASTRE